MDDGFIASAIKQPKTSLTRLFSVTHSIRKHIMNSGFSIKLGQIFAQTLMDPWLCSCFIACHAAHHTTLSLSNICFLRANHPSHCCQNGSVAVQCGL